MERFDAIVIGLGAHGRAAGLALARRGLRVLGVEAGERGHELGSSGGRSRMIRRAYFEDPAYLPLLAAAWDAWEVLGKAAGERLVEVTGGLYAGPAASDVFRGSVQSARDQGIAHEVLDAAEIRRRWPIFTVGDEMGGLYDPGAGMVRPERAIEVQLALAEDGGAVLRFGERAVDWRPAPAGDGIEVETDSGVYRADHLVIAAGAWTGYFVPDLRLPIEVERMPVFWFKPDVPVGDVSVGRLPMWIMDTGASGIFYGFPYDAGAGLKVSRHHSEDVVDPDSVDRAQHQADVERVRAFMRHNMPAANGALLGATVCLYANTPDRNFVIDVHPAPGVAFASACSGHGFKFAPVIGDILADLAISGSTIRPIEPFRAARFPST